MTTDPVIVTNGANVPVHHESTGDFEYAKRLVVPRTANQATVAFMEIPPGKSGYPYHWHEAVTEVYVILAGNGTLRTPAGARAVSPGDVVVIPPGPEGAHRLTNTGPEPLRYVDVDTTSPADVCHYPDSGKVGLILGGVMTSVFKDDAEVDYYEGEADAH